MRAGGGLVNRDVGYNWASGCGTGRRNAETNACRIPRLVYILFMMRRACHLAAALVSLFPALLRAQDQDPTYGQMNDAFGVPLWSSDTLWTQSAEETAGRLQWPLESKTSQDSSYRSYPMHALQILGSHPYSLVLDGKADGTIAEVSMVFANLGDSTDLAKDPAMLDDLNTQRDFVEQVQKIVGQEVRDMDKKFTDLIGPFRSVVFGQDDNVHRWDWNGQSILLIHPEEKYLILRIVPTEQLDNHRAHVLESSELRKQLAARVEHRPNGDVILKDIPMVDQGPKGYCVPATWERDLRYLGIPADMYALAMAAASQAGGGTSLTSMIAGVEAYVRNNDCELVTETGPIDIHDIADKINRGLPIMWSIDVDPALNDALTLRSAARLGVTDWDAYKASLAPFRKAAQKIVLNPMNGHMCMIIGYNMGTRELAISDSWGPEFAERWITVEEAQAISQGKFYLVTW